MPYETVLSQAAERQFEELWVEERKEMRSALDSLIANATREGYAGEWLNLMKLRTGGRFIAAISDFAKITYIDYLDGESRKRHSRFISRSSANGHLGWYWLKT